MKVAVVGAGIVGAAAAWALTRDGADVTVYEQFDVAEAKGSSRGRTRIFRLAYVDPAWTRLAREALDGWRELERESGRELLGLHGLVEVASAQSLTSADALDACGEEYRFLDWSEALALGVAPPAGWTALYQPQAGVVHADRARAAFLELAVARGARIEERTRVGSIDEVEADVVVVAVGPWAHDLLPDLAVRVTRETVAYFNLAGAPPPSVVELDEATRLHALYALHDPVYGLKVGAHHAGAEASAEADPAPDPAIVARIAEWVRHRLPDADPEPTAAEACFYTSTEDESFVLERRDRLVVASACSGHGFKFAPATGKRLAELALG